MAEVTGVLTKIPNRSDDDSFIDDISEQASQEPMEEQPDDLEESDLGILNGFNPQSESMVSNRVEEEPPNPNTIPIIQRQLHDDEGMESQQKYCLSPETSEFEESRRRSVIPRQGSNWKTQKIAKQKARLKQKLTVRSRCGRITLRYHTDDDSEFDDKDDPAPGGHLLSAGPIAQ